MPDLEQRDNPYNVTQASRIYFLPNLMTAGNLFCGFVAVIKCIQARLIIDAGEYAAAHPGLSGFYLLTMSGHTYSADEETMLAVTRALLDRVQPTALLTPQGALSGSQQEWLDVLKA